MKQEIFKDTSVQFLGKIASSGLSFITMLILARILGGNNFGDLVKILTFLSFFQVAVDLGLNPIFLRMYSGSYRYHISALIGIRLLISIGLSLAAIFIIELLSKFNPGINPIVKQGVNWGFIILVGYALILSTGALFQREKLFRRQTSAQIGGSFFGLLLAIGMYFLNLGNRDVLTAVVVVAAGLWLNVALAIWLSRLPMSSLTPFIKPLIWKKIFITSLPLGTIMIINAVLFRLDIYFLTAYRSSFEVGVYGLAYKFFELAISLPTLIMNSFYPYLLSTIHDKRQLWIWLKETLRKIFGLSLIVAFILITSSYFIHFVKSEYEQSENFVRLLAFGVPLFFVTAPMMWLYVLLEKEKWLLCIYGSGLVLNAILNRIYIPLYGATAAALTTIGTEFWIFIIGAVILLYIKKYEYN